MEVHYRREGGEIYLVWQEEGEGDEYTIRILTEHQIPTLLPLRVRQINQMKEYAYPLSRSISVENRFARRSIIEEDMENILLGIYRGMLAMGEYLLEVDRLVLDPEFLYQNAQGEGLWLCCYPGEKRDFGSEMEKLTKFFLEKIDHEDANAVYAAYELFRLSNGGNFSFSELLDVFQHLPEEEEREDVLEEQKQEALPKEESWAKSEELPDFLKEGGKEKKVEKKKAFLPCAVMGLLLFCYFRGGLDFLPTFLLYPLFFLVVIFGVFFLFFVEKGEKGGKEKGDSEVEPGKEEVFPPASLRIAPRRENILTYSDTENAEEK